MHATITPGRLRVICVSARDYVLAIAVGVEFHIREAINASAKVDPNVIGSRRESAIIGNTVLEFGAWTQLSTTAIIVDEGANPPVMGTFL